MIITEEMQIFFIFSALIIDNGSECMKSLWEKLWLETHKTEWNNEDQLDKLKEILPKDVLLFNMCEFGDESKVISFQNNMLVKGHENWSLTLISNLIRKTKCVYTYPSLIGKIDIIMDIFDKYYNYAPSMRMNIETYTMLKIKLEKVYNSIAMYTPKIKTHIIEIDIDSASLRRACIFTASK
jgi:hypothetical protein